MAVPSPRFTCYTAQKVVVFEDREEVLKEQRSKLESYLKGDEGDKVVLSGGCISASPGLLGHGSGYVAAFSGFIDNFSQLSKQLTIENSDTNSARYNQALCAELVCNLYKVYGRIVPQRLRGDFSFVLYDSAQGRVLAAASHTSRWPLLQARGPDGCLIITTRDAASLPDGAALVTAIPPGHVKYGWSSDPQSFTDPRIAAELKNIKIGKSPTKAMALLNSTEAQHVDENGESEEPQSPAIKKTRRGKRAGKNQKLRAELMSRLNSDLGSGRGSLDQRHSMEFGGRSFDASTRSLDFGPATPSSSFSSRADGQSWWRTDTPRSSFEVRSLPNNNGFVSRPSLSGMSSFSRNSMSANASPFVPAASLTSQPTFTAHQPINIVRSPSSGVNSAGTGKRSEAQDANFSRVVLRSSMSGALSGALSGSFSPFQAPIQPATPGKADAAWHEGDEAFPSPSASPRQYVPEALNPRLSPSSNPTPYTRTLSSALPADQQTLQRSLNPKGEAEAAQNAEAEDTERHRDDSAESHPQPVRASVTTRSDSAHVDLPAESARKAPGGRTAPINIQPAQKKETAFVESSRRAGSASDSEPSDKETPAGGSPRGSSPTRPPKHPGGAFRHMFKSLMLRRPSHPDLESEEKKHEHSEQGQAENQASARSASHGALVELDGPTGLWDAPGKATGSRMPSTNLGSSGSLASQRSSEKSRPRSGKSSPHGSHHNLAWLARQTRNIFKKDSRSKSCTDLTDMDDMPVNKPATVAHAS